MNEDTCLVAGAWSGASNAVPSLVAVAGGPWIVAVSDGIGGHHAGEEASRAVVETLAACPRVTPAGVRDALRLLNRELCERGRRDPACQGMGATVAGVACGAKGPFAFNVGDSRVYQVERGRLAQITRDDSEAEELIEMGLLSRDDAIRPGYLHALTQAIGGRIEHVQIEVHTHALKITERSRFLVCSDGLTDMVGRTMLEEIMAAGRAAEVTVEALFSLAMDAGGLDNITLAVLDVEPHPRSRPGSARS
ncbi:MAG: family protein phosphatase [Chthoniobacter sp.]|jgi:serine/threonine protein phosphatase PrpC|nr:family protein phosphatase [Chthoniobacter sp.]